MCKQSILLAHVKGTQTKFLVVYEGFANNPYGEFFIAGNKSLQKDYDVKNWRKQLYNIKDGNPSFLVVIQRF
ncbi:hypothetical protein RGQ29_031430 [Quercus rubra]|uniref:Uncharacterized protein n=1 Tax=Quercus rubra TaxID=3512 RepID=A0AAN7EKB0_QUERU|nr:hypothetical protein RGQ29_031430 [Quercus rubra]